jgi:hypothetical protein
MDLKKRAARYRMLLCQHLWNKGTLSFAVCFRYVTIRQAPEKEKYHCVLYLCLFKFVFQENKKYRSSILQILQY